MPRVPLPPTRKALGQPLEVFASIWLGRRSYRDRAGKQVRIESYEEAREYAASHGYNGIRITYR